MTDVQTKVPNEFERLAETIAPLAEQVTVAPLSASWIYDAIRHYERNVSWDAPTDGVAAGRWDGTAFANFLNQAPTFRRALRLAAVVEEAETALSSIADAAAEIVDTRDGDFAFLQARVREAFAALARIKAAKEG